jgi:hypothetical protein
MVTTPGSPQAEHNRRTRNAYDRLAAVWSATTDNGPFNGLLERPALRALLPAGLAGAVVLDAGCGSGAQARWLLGPRLPGQQGRYFDTELVTDTWRKADVEVSQQFWRRPLSAVADAFADAGFVIDRIAEPQPSQEALERFPSELADVAGVPAFIVYRLQLAR